jgi:hypothetical protein
LCLAVLYIFYIIFEFHSFLTSALGGSEWLTSCPDCFTWERTLVPIEQEAGCAPELVGTFVWDREEKNLLLLAGPGIFPLHKVFMAKRQGKSER